MAGFLDEVRSYVAGGQSGPGQTGTPGLKMPAPRNFVAGPPNTPSAPVGRPPTTPATAQYAGTSGATGAGAGVAGNTGGAAPTAPGGAPTSPSGAPGTAMPGAGVVPPVGPPPIGYPDPSGSGDIILSPEGKLAYQDRIAKARLAFGPYPGADDPTRPAPPLIPGKMFFNPFTGKYGRA